MDKETKLEKLSGALSTTSVATLIAAVSGTPVAALLPVLTGTLASNRHKDRVEDAIKELENDLRQLGDKIEKITDAQYKFINETVITILNSPDDEKLQYLKNSIKNIILLEQIDMHQSGIVSRVLRDITVQELLFLMKTKGKKIVFDHAPDQTGNYIECSMLANGCELTTSLIALGLLTQDYRGVGADYDIEAYIQTSIANRLIHLVE